KENKTKMQLSSLFSVSLVIIALATSHVDAFTRHDFPKDFLFGAASSAYQWEGAFDEEGRTPSVWDTFAHSNNMGDGDIACDGYHKYKEDVKLMAEMGLEAFRFSISWTRLIPNGRGPINPKGLWFYKNLIKELRNHGIEPHVTLYHYDLPQTFEDEYGGWINRKIIEDFTAFADVCFREFGDDVKLWTTINEATIFAIASYSEGFAPPGHCSPSKFSNCSTGNSSTEPYLAGHNMLLAHASASKLYRLKYKSKQRGSVGFSIYAFGLSPYSNSKDDQIATQRAEAFLFGWMLKPLVFGKYPDEMKRILGSRLPVFSEEESEQVKGSSDFVGIIHYMTVYVKNNKPTPPLLPSRHDFYTDMGAETIFMENSTFFEWEATPQGLESVLENLKQNYNNPPIYILENGKPMKHGSTLQDSERVEYIQAYLGAALNAIKNGSDTRSYFVWSMIDLYELLSGYMYSYGMYYVNFSDPGLKRSPKLSASWYSGFLNGTVDIDPQAITRLQSNFSEGVNRFGKTGIEPQVTLYHYDLPQPLEDEYGGWINRKIIEFGDDVKLWTTVNEANIFAVGAYSGGMLKPLEFGDYPDVMKRSLGSRLPVFSEEESEKVKGSSDFVGIIHYTTLYVRKRRPAPSVLPSNREFFTDMGVDMLCKPYFAFIINQSEKSRLDSFWLIILLFFSQSLGNPHSWDNVPWGFEIVLEYLKHNYDNPPIYILESGKPMEHGSGLQDAPRAEYIESCIGAVLNAIKNGSDTRGYFVWSMIDLYELLFDYKNSYGMYYVNFSDPDLKRSPKLSASWYSGFLNGTIDADPQAITRLQSNFSGSSSF
ncbi:unnamed protein product, partial [Thlaspi arvense]